MGHTHRTRKMISIYSTEEKREIHSIQVKKKNPLNEYSKFPH